ncbi:uncharacterized protein LOC135385741 [Ornithodoros turicata]|uniref:uncharacterized protein LOC135385741 n=1 Tax=Ornithodoros turicata TaxID=34597 RepID=UPI00313A169E
MMLVAFTSQHHRDWDLRLTELAFATRTTVNRSTGFTPAFLNLGREAPFPVENALGLWDGSTQPPYSRYAEDLQSRLDVAARTARENLDVARLDQARQYNRGRRNLTYSVGDLVLRRTHPLSDASRGFAASLADRWDGPFERPCLPKESVVAGLDALQDLVHLPPGLRYRADPSHQLTGQWLHGPS